MAEKFFPWVEKLGATGKVLANAIAKTCGFYNDTKYRVTLTLHDGAVNLDPGESVSNWIVTGFSVYMTMHFPNWEPRIEFPSSDFQQTEHKLSAVFADHIRRYENGGEEDDNSKGNNDGGQHWTVENAQQVVVVQQGGVHGNIGGVTVHKDHTS